MRKNALDERRKLVYSSTGVDRENGEENERGYIISPLLHEFVTISSHRFVCNWRVGERGRGGEGERGRGGVLAEHHGSL